MRAKSYAFPRLTGVAPEFASCIFCGGKKLYVAPTLACDVCLELFINGGPLYERLHALIGFVAPIEDKEKSDA